MNMYERTIPQIWNYVVKRFFMLIAKLTGFKSFCLALSTVLLCNNVISSDIWVTVMITILCRTSGLKLVDSLDIAKKVNNEKANFNSMSDYDGDSSCYGTRKSKSTERIINKGKQKIRKILNG